MPKRPSLQPVLCGHTGPNLALVCFPQTCSAAERAVVAVKKRRTAKRPFSKAAGKSKPEAYLLGYVEDFEVPRTLLAGFFSVLES